MSDNEQEPPKEQKPGAESMNIKVISSDGNEVFFKIKKTTKLNKLKNAYSDRVGKNVSTIKFLYDGQRVQDDDTPESLGLDDGDSIDAMIEQVGGSA